MTTRSIVALGSALVLVASVAHGALFCRRKNGAVFIRETCKRHETVFNAAALGTGGPKGDVGPKGDPGMNGATGAAGSARAYGCPNVSLDGSLVVPCGDRPGKNVLQVSASTTRGNATCFALDPSIDASAAVVLVSWNENTSTSSGPNIILTVEAGSVVMGCPPNSIKVGTGRTTSVAGGLSSQAVRLAVNVAVM